VFSEIQDSKQVNESHQFPVADLAANLITSKEQVYIPTRSLVKNSFPAQTHYDQVEAGKKIK